MFIHLGYSLSKTVKGISYVIEQIMVSNDGNFKGNHKWHDTKGFPLRVRQSVSFCGTNHGTTSIPSSVLSRYGWENNCLYTNFHSVSTIPSAIFQVILQ